ALRAGARLQAGRRPRAHHRLALRRLLEVAAAGDLRLPRRGPRRDRRLVRRAEDVAAARRRARGVPVVALLYPAHGLRRTTWTRTTPPSRPSSGSASPGSG